MLPAAPLARSMPHRIGPYRVLGPLGRGGMAIVYEAVRHGAAGFERPVVIKVMDADQATDPELIALFKGEARLLAGLHHPNIVQVQDFGVHEGQFYLVLERLEGCDLMRLLRGIEGPLPPGIALRIAVQVADALGHAHSFDDGSGKPKQIIHRDVSPSNVFVCNDGTVKMLDFGVASVLSAYELHQSKHYRGKFAYMAPEELDGKPFDCRVDVFALGVLLHEMLTGRRLFRRTGVEETMQAVRELPVPLPSASVPGLPREIDEVVMTALERDPARRYPSGVELADALEDLARWTATRRGLAGYVAHHAARPARRLRPAPRRRRLATPLRVPAPERVTCPASLVVDIEEVPLSVDNAAAEAFDVQTTLDPPREFSSEWPAEGGPLGEADGLVKVDGLAVADGLVEATQADPLVPRLVESPWASALWLGLAMLLATLLAYGISHAG
jgi:serine/threonine-protein kinase